MMDRPTATGLAPNLDHVKRDPDGLLLASGLELGQCSICGLPQLGLTDRQGNVFAHIALEPEAALRIALDLTPQAAQTISAQMAAKAKGRRQ